MASKGMRVPKQIFARIERDSSGEEYIQAHEHSDNFDEEGPVGRYELVETGKITIAHSFVSQVRRGGSADDRRRGA